MTFVYTPVLATTGAADKALPAPFSPAQAGVLPASPEGALAGPSWVEQGVQVLPASAAQATSLAEPMVLSMPSGASESGAGAAPTGLPMPPDLFGVALLLGALLVLAGWRRARR